MITKTYQRTYPKYGIATAILAVLFIGIPFLLITIDPGAGEELTIAAETTESNLNNMAFSAPDGWNKVDSEEAIILSKGSATIEIRPLPWSGSPAELYENNRQQISQALKIISIEDPSPTDLVAGMPAVKGQIHMIYNGQDMSGFIVVASDGKTGLVTDLNGPLLDIQPLRAEYHQVLSTITISKTEDEQ